MHKKITLALKSTIAFSCIVAYKAMQYELVRRVTRKIPFGYYEIWRLCLIGFLSKNSEINKPRHEFNNVISRELMLSQSISMPKVNFKEKAIIIMFSAVEKYRGNYSLLIWMIKVAKDYGLEVCLATGWPYSKTKKQKLLDAFNELGVNKVIWLNNKRVNNEEILGGRAFYMSASNCLLTTKFAYFLKDTMAVHYIHDYSLRQNPFVKMFDRHIDIFKEQLDLCVKCGVEGIKYIPLPTLVPTADNFELETTRTILARQSISPCNFILIVASIHKLQPFEKSSIVDVMSAINDNPMWCLCIVSDASSELEDFLDRKYNKINYLTFRKQSIANFSKYINFCIVSWPIPGGVVEREYIELGMPFFGKRQSLKLLFGDKAYEDFTYEDVSDLICLPVERIDSLAAEQKQWSGNAAAEKAFLEICNQEIIFDVVLSQH